MTDAQAQKLNGIQAGAEVNAIKGIQKNGTDIQPDATSKKVNISVPTKTSDLENDDNVVKDANYVHTEVNFTSTKDSKLAGIAAGAQVNVVEIIKINGTALTPSGKVVNINVPTDNVSLANGAGYQTAAQVNNLIDSKITSVYKPGGSKNAAELTSALLVAANEGRTYNLSDALVITAQNKGLFVENATGEYPAGTNVQVINTASSGTAVYKFDVLGGLYDLSSYYNTSNLAVITAAELDEILV